MTRVGILKLPVRVLERLLVFIENTDDDTFYQVSLTPEQFKKLSDVIIRERKKDNSLKENIEIVEVKLVDKVKISRKVFENLNSHE